MRYFAVPDDVAKLKRLAGYRHQPGENPVFERVHGEVRPLVLILMELVAEDPRVQSSAHLQKVFNDPTGVELFKVIIPAGKSFTTDADTLSDDDLKTRIERLFCLLMRSIAWRLGQGLYQRSGVR